MMLYWCNVVFKDDPGDAVLVISAVFISEQYIVWDFVAFELIQICYQGMQWAFNSFKGGDWKLP